MLSLAQYLWHQILNKPRIKWVDNASPYLGQSYETPKSLLQYHANNSKKIKYRESSDNEVVELLSKGKIVCVSGGGSDFWTLAAVAAMEDSDGQARADVAQSIYNRKASGAYGGGTIRELIIADKQFQPTWDYPRKNTGMKANPEWLAITNAASAAAATGKSVAFINQAAADIQNKQYQDEAKKFVGGRTDFTNYSKTNVSVIL